MHEHMGWSHGIRINTN